MRRLFIVLLILACGRAVAQQTIGPTKVQGPLTVTGDVTAGPNSQSNLNVLAALGDSNVSGFVGIPVPAANSATGVAVPIDSYPSILQNILGPTLNFGVGGTTSIQAAVTNGALATSFSNYSGNIAACPTGVCAPISVVLPTGFGISSNSVTGTVASTPARHGTLTLQSELEQNGAGGSTWTISGGVSTMTNLVLVAGQSTVMTSGMLVFALNFSGYTGCSDINGIHTLTGGSSTGVTWATSCTGAGSTNSGGTIVLMNFTPDPYSLAATLSGTPAFTADNPCAGCNILLQTGNNNLFVAPSLGGLAVVENNVAQIAAQTTGYFVVLPAIPDNTPSHWIGGGSYATFNTYRNDLAALYPNSFVDTWTALLGAANLSLPTDAADVLNGIPPTSLRMVGGYGTMTGSSISTDTCSATNIVVTLAGGGITGLGVLTLDPASSTSAENINVLAFTGTNPYTITSCTRGFGGMAVVAHTTGAIAYFSDGTHMNGKGQAVIANAVAAHIKALAGTKAITVSSLGTAIGNFLANNPFQRGITVGGNIQTPITIAGDPSSGLQTIVGTKSGQASHGTMYGGSQYVASNAVQCGGVGVDLWCQPFSASSSYQTRMDLNGFQIYSAAASSASAKAATFWGSKLAAFLSNSISFFQPAFFTSNANTFANGQDANNTLVFTSGLTADAASLMQYRDYLNATQFQAGKYSDNSYRVTDVNGLFRLLFGQNSTSHITSGAGTGAVIVNQLANSGTGGLIVAGGSASPVNWALLQTTGISSYKDFYFEGLAGGTNYFELTGVPSGHIVITAIPVSGTLGVIPTQSSGHAVCETASHTLGHCTSVVASDGTCTCT